mmetsp:Transcript_29532/g.77443  ORF Transcript_29532/g.77443 Transcript_29532/m.77443 type:complete len:207 (+) Transcript_29532:2117-2737(+)
MVVVMVVLLSGLFKMGAACAGREAIAASILVLCTSFLGVVTLLLHSVLSRGGVFIVHGVHVVVASVGERFLCHRRSRVAPSHPRRAASKHVVGIAILLGCAPRRWGPAAGWLDCWQPRCVALHCRPGTLGSRCTAMRQQLAAPWRGRTYSGLAASAAGGRFARRLGVVHTTASSRRFVRGMHRFAADFAACCKLFLLLPENIAFLL